MAIFHDSETEFQMFIPSSPQHTYHNFCLSFILMHSQCKTLLAYQPILTLYLISLTLLTTAWYIVRYIMW